MWLSARDLEDRVEDIRVSLCLHVPDLYLQGCLCPELNSSQQLSTLTLGKLSDNPSTRLIKRRVEIKRFSDASSWRYVKSADMSTDLGTRRCSLLSEVNSNSKWINGFDWMQKDESYFPMLAVYQIKLSSREKEEMKKEMLHEEFTSEGISCS